VSASSVSRNGVSVPTTVLTAANDPNKYTEVNEAFVIPSSALNPNTTYQVTLAGTINGTPFNRSFSMSTGQ
jgi:predicted alpha/beta-fold hydrolase